MTRGFDKPFGQETWCICTGYTSLLKQEVRKLCPHLCSIGQTLRMHVLTRQGRSNLLRSSPLLDKKKHLHLSPNFS